MSTLWDRFVMAATEAPQSTAVVLPAAGNIRGVGATDHLTYTELLSAARVIAKILLEDDCVRVGDRIALLLEPSLEQIVVLLGILCAGCTYVPLHPAHPRQHQEITITNTRATHVIGLSSAYSALSQMECFSGSVRVLECPREVCVPSAEDGPYIPLHTHAYTQSSIRAHTGIPSHTDAQVQTPPDRLCEPLDIAEGQQKHKRTCVGVARETVGRMFELLLFHTHVSDHTRTDPHSKTAYEHTQTRTHTHEHTDTHAYEPTGTHTHKRTSNHDREEKGEAGGNADSAVRENVGGVHAYVMTTSGTTGAPTTVAVPHRAIVTNLDEICDAFGLCQGDVVLLSSAYTFDMSVIDIFGTLLCKATLVLLPEADRIAYRSVAYIILSQQVTVLHCTPSFLLRLPNEIACSAQSRLRLVALGGEQFPGPIKIKQWLTSTPMKIEKWDSAATSTTSRSPLDTNPPAQVGTSECDSTAATHKPISARHGVALFNLYGTTELSVWAMSHRVGTLVGMSRRPNERPRPASLVTATDATTAPPGTPTKANGLQLMAGAAHCGRLTCRTYAEDSFPLGKALPSVEVKVNPTVVQDKSEQEIYIGGLARVCDIQGMPYGEFRRSGDITHVCECGRWWYVGRTNGQFKRHGHRLHYAQIERAVRTGWPGVDACAAVYVDGSDTLAVFVQVQQLHPFNAQKPSAAGAAGTSVVFRVPQHSWVSDDSLLNSSADQTADILSIGNIALHLLRILPHHAVPNAVYCTQSLPLTTNGKVDRRCLATSLPELVRNHDRQERKRRKLNCKPKVATRLLLLQQITNTLEYTGSGSAAPEDRADCYFAATGHSSLDAVRVVSAISALSDTSLSTTTTQLLLDAVLHRPFDFVLDLSLQLLSTSSNKKTEMAASSILTNENAEMAPPRSPPSSAQRSQKENTERTSLWRVSWRVAMGKCVDSSPIVVHLPTEYAGPLDGQTRISRDDDAYACVGSHAGVFTCVRICDGSVRFRVDFGSRIETAAGYAPLSDRLLVGCHDNRLLILNARTGGILHTHTFANAIKTGVVVIRTSPQSYHEFGCVGSHDGTLYSVDVLTGCIAGSVSCGGPIRATPTVDPQRARVYVTTLTGDLLCLGFRSSATSSHSDPTLSCAPVFKVIWTVLWTFKADDRPIFTSPALCSNGLLVITVSGTAHMVDYSGVEVWRRVLDVPVYSSPVVLHTATAHECAVFGAHDGHLRCLAMPHGYLLSSVTTRDGVYAQVASIESQSERRELFVIAMDGTILGYSIGPDGICHPTGSLMTLPAQVFSSPALVSDANGGAMRLLVGCRDNYLYCLSATERTSPPPTRCQG